MSMPNSSTQVPTPCAVPPPAVLSSAEVDQELKDWDAYVRMLLAGTLTQFAGEFVVVHQGKVVAHGSDLEKLRQCAAEQFGIALGKVVIPFVEDSEGIIAE